MASPSPHHGVWLYEKEGKQVGPVSESYLIQLVELGEILPNTMVWKKGLEDWVPANRVRFLPFERPPRRTEEAMGTNAFERMCLPVGRSGWAIAAGYLGLLSILFLPAPFAIWTGIMAIREIKQDPTKHGMGRAIFGMVMGSLILILLLIGITVGVGRRAGSWFAVYGGYGHN